MASRVLLKVILLIAFIAGTIDSADLALKTIHLSDVTPQGILRLSSKSKQNEQDGKCDYLVTISPVGDTNHSNLIGISAGVLGMQLVNGSSVRIIPHDSSSNETTFKNNMDEVEGKCYWDASSSPSYSRNVESECLLTNTDVCIQLQGNWNQSKAELLLNIYYEYDRKISCPEGTVQCKCNNDDDEDNSSEEGYSKTRQGRCIPDDLTCNGVPNCGVNCNFDESESLCAAPSTEYGSCVWTKFEYLAMMVMTGLLLLLIPIFFLLAIMYHKRRPPIPSPLNGLPLHFDGNNNRTSSIGRYPHVISTLPVHMDPPPRYEDLPDDFKIPMPSRNEQNPRE